MLMNIYFIVDVLFYFSLRGIISFLFCGGVVLDLLSFSVLLWLVRGVIIFS